MMHAVDWTPTLANITGIPTVRKHAKKKTKKTLQACLYFTEEFVFEFAPQVYLLKCYERVRVLLFLARTTNGTPFGVA